MFVNLRSVEPIVHYMHKIQETVLTIIQATKYSFAFCWRNNRFATSIRIGIAVANTLTVYFTIQAMGWLVNVFQSITSHMAGTRYSFADFIHGEAMVPIVFLLGVIVFNSVALRLNSYIKGNWNQTLFFANQRELNEHRATLDIARFRSEEFDTLIRRIDELPWSWKTRIQFADQMIELFTTTLSFVLFGVSLVWYQPWYAVILVVTAIPMVINEFQAVQESWDIHQTMVPLHKKRHVLEKVYNRPIAFMQAQMFNQMPVLRKEIDINVGGIIDTFKKLRRLNLQKQTGNRLVMLCGLAGVITYASWSTLALAASVGTLTVIIGAARTFQGNLEAMVALVADQWNSAKGVILIEEEFLGLKSTIVTVDPVVPSFSGIPKIVFDHVSFSYPQSDTLAIRDVSFTITPGSKVAIVGKSGNGKSTLQALLMRHYDPTSGTITADGVDLKRIDPSVWSRYASALTQEYLVLERTVADEIASSRMDEIANRERILGSAEFANFSEVLESDTHGFDTQIGEEFGGRDFSGGEKQRLALARVHYRGTPILILDEPDAKLDPDSAKKVIDHVFALKDTTVIMITHHVSRAERCDEVIMMGKGRIVERGAPAELLARRGAFAEMYQDDKDRLNGVEK